MSAPLVDTIDAAVAEASERFSRARPRTKALHEEALAVMPGGNTRTVLFTAPFPIRIAHAEGAVIRDIDGHSYVDLLGEYSAGLYGHSHRRIKQAVAEALAGGINLGAHSEMEVRFAQIVAERFALDLVRFTNSGTEANMMALGAARAFTKRPRILGIKGGYHGGTLYFGGGGAAINAPYDVVLAPFNDIAWTRKLIAEHAASLAAVIIEPMLGSGGCLAADRDYLEMLRRETAARGILLIFDEVMTSRLAPGGLSATLGIAPDLKTLGKYIGGGMSFGAFGGRRDIMQQFDPTRPDFLPHAGTFNNNMLTMTAGFAALSEIFTPSACLELNRRGDGLRERLNDLFMRYQVRLKATGLGSLINLHPLAGEIRTPDDVGKSDPRLRQLLYLDLLEEGYYTAGRGYMALSLMVSDAHCESFCAAVERVVTRRRHLFSSP
ncbi:aspartate aminotransferase family protein [Taklimakanibacter lacteus]|uniref:aspartate aminotransferase family protein n=1 Tax=Taklimakanibacter lacteus TaxID=2268456 RepID=UPI0034D7A9EE